MSTTTTNYNLVKPELTDAADITAMNQNWDTIDTMLKNLANEGWLTPVTTENQNLDNYVTQGIYSFDSAYAPINRPDGNSNGWLIVIPWNNTPGVGTVKQLWLRRGALNSNDHCLYVRTRISSDNAWSTWAQIYTTKDITVNLADINALGTTIAQVNNIGNALDEKAPINHASSSDTYGKGTDTNYGHVKLSNSTTSTSGTSGGTAATPAAVKAAYDLADGKQDSLTFDNMPTQNSDNPVKSGGVFSALANKQDSLTFDNTPTRNSANPVKSGGVFSALAEKANTEDIGNLWVWEKFNYTPASYHDGETHTNVTIMGEGGGSTYYAVTIYYSDSISVDEYGMVRLINPSTLDLSYSDYSRASVFKGKYIRIGANSVAFIPTTATFSRQKDGNTYEVLVSTLTYIVGVKPVFSHVEYVSSPNSFTYPENGQSGDYWYTRLGQIGEGMTKIETGSYVGTGTYGEDNPNSLTFGFVPKVVFIYPKEPSLNAAGVVAVYGAIYAMDHATNRDISIIWSNKQMSWYSSSAPIRQFNDTDVKYIYVAIG